jgi:hypothetical protein
VAITPFDFFVPVPRPERPKDKIGSVSPREEREPVDSTVLPDPVPNLNVIRMSIFGESRRFRLLGREETLLLLRSLEKESGCGTMGLRHDGPAPQHNTTNLLWFCQNSHAFLRSRAAMPNAMLFTTTKVESSYCNPLKLLNLNDGSDLVSWFQPRSSPAHGQTPTYKVF